jgi:hypothetical protein
VDLAWTAPWSSRADKGDSSRDLHRGMCIPWRITADQAMDWAYRTGAAAIKIAPLETLTRVLSAWEHPRPPLFGGPVQSTALCTIRDSDFSEFWHKRQNANATQSWACSPVGPSRPGDRPLNTHLQCFQPARTSRNCPRGVPIAHRHDRPSSPAHTRCQRGPENARMTTRDAAFLSWRHPPK